MPRDTQEFLVDVVEAALRVATVQHPERKVIFERASDVGPIVLSVDDAKYQIDVWHEAS